MINAMKNIDYNKHIWEGWLVKDFIEELNDVVDIFVSNSNEFHSKITKEDLKKFIVDNQPYYKKEIPEVIEYFINKYNIK